MTLLTSVTASLNLGVIVIHLFTHLVLGWLLYLPFYLSLTLVNLDFVLKSTFACDVVVLPKLGLRIMILLIFKLRGRPTFVSNIVLYFRQLIGIGRNTFN